MKVGITYDLKEQYGFDTLDLKYTDFQKTDDVEYAKSKILEMVDNVILIGNSSDLLDYINKGNDIDLVFNMSWGFKGRNREGLIPAILESYGIKYTGTDAFGCSFFLDKIQTKLLANYLGVNTPKFFSVNNELDLPQLPFPMILKPNSQGTGMGVTLVENISEYNDTIKKLLNEYGAPILCEEYIQGLDVTVPMLEKDNDIYGLNVLSILDTDGKILKLYDAKIKSSRNCTRTIYNGSCDIKNNLIESSRKIFKYMNGHDFGRADFKISYQGIPYFLEMAPLPSLAHNGSFCQCAKLCGCTSEYVFRSIIESSLNRYGAADLLKKS